MEGINVSPDRKLLAYNSYAPDPGEAAVVILNADGQAIATLDKNQAGQGMDWFTWLEIDPTLTRLAYVTGGENSLYANGAALVDVPDGKIRWQTSSSWVRFVPAAWSPDGQRLLAIGDEQRGEFEISIIERDGNAETWAYLPHDEMILLSMTSWSPDGRYVAIGGETLYVLDTALNQLLEYCTAIDWLAWSPDSTQLIAHQQSNPSPEHANILFDLTRQQAARLTPLGQDVWALGWLVDDVNDLPVAETPQPTVVPTLPPPPAVGSLPIASRSWCWIHTRSRSLISACRQKSATKLTFSGPPTVQAF